MRLLLAEDNQDHAYYIKKVLMASEMVAHVEHVENGEDAVAFMEQKGRYQDAASPDLVLLDLNMPKMNGHEVLDRIKADAAIKRIPVVVLTTSNADTDRNLAFEKYANSYVVKPVRLEEFKKTISEVLRYWYEYDVGPGIMA